MAALGTTNESVSVLGDRFALSVLMGSGTSARVFLATDLRLQCPVAVKVLHESLASDARFVTQLRREARLAASLSHDHIVTVLDSGETTVDGLEIPYIATEYMAGGSLAAILDGGVILDPAQTASVGSQAADALTYAHEQGLIHRDVKPSNLLFDTDGRLALADFGIARAVAEASATEPTDSGAGATRYASPEAVMGRRAEPRSDVYSLALVLLECLTGEVPLLGDSPVATMGRRVRESVDVPSGLGQLGEALIAATQRDPDDRCTAGDLAAMLESACDALGEPDLLPLRPVAVKEDETVELTIDRSGGSVRILGVAPMGTAASVNDGDRAGFIDLTGDPALDSDGTEDAAEFGRDAITVAEEYHALDASRPGSHGVVEPLDVPLVPTPLDVPKGRSGRRRSSEKDKAKRDASNRSAHEDPRGKRRWIAIAALVALVLGGTAVAGWWFLVRIPTHEVPDWVGSDIAEVTAAAEANGWEVGEIRHDRSDGTAPGQVLAQDPEPGTELSEGEQVSFTVSDGPTLTVIPTINGLPEAEAVAQLEAAGLAPGARSGAYDEAVPSGSVIGAVVAEGAEAPGEAGEVPKGTVIDLVVSEGPAPRVVPEGIVGVPRASAQKALTAVQLGVATSEQYSSEVERGYVISSDVAPGTEVPRDSVVSLVVSAGPEPIVVPEVTGQTGTSAASALERAGFEVSGIEGSPSGVVLATDPPAGESRLPGASVRIFTRTG
jgi:serine/threonine-protein kinase